MMGFAEYLIFSVVCAAFYMPLIAFAIICAWRIYEKAGRKGWESIIPFYSTLVMIQFLRKPKEWFTYIIVGFAVYFAFYITGAVIIAALHTQIGAIIAGIFMIMIAIAALVIITIYTVKLHIALSESFGYPKAFTWLLLVWPVYYGILAFDKNNSFRLPENTGPQ